MRRFVQLAVVVPLILGSGSCVDSDAVDRCEARLRQADTAWEASLRGGELYPKSREKVAEAKVGFLRALSCDTHEPRQEIRALRGYAACAVVLGERRSLSDALVRLEGYEGARSDREEFLASLRACAEVRRDEASAFIVATLQSGGTLPIEVDDPLPTGYPVENVIFANSHDSELRAIAGRVRTFWLQ